MSRRRSAADIQESLAEIDDLDEGTFPRFRVIVCDLGRHPAVYEHVMNEVLVARTGRFQLLGEPKKTIDPVTGNVLGTLEVIDNGPEAVSADVY